MKQYIKILLCTVAILLSTINWAKSQQIYENLAEDLIKGFKNNDRNAIQQTEKKLISLKDNAIPTIEKYLSHEEKAVCSALINVLGGINTEESTKLLLKVFCNTNNIDATYKLEDRRIAFSVETKFLESLKNKIATSKDWRIMSKAARIFAKIEGIDIDLRVDEVLNALKKEIQKPSSLEKLRGSYATVTEYIRRQYILALSDIGYQAIPYLKQALTESTSIIEKQYMLIALGFLKDEEVFSELCDMVINEKEGYIRYGAARALGNIGNKDAIPLLLEMLHDPFVVPSGLDVFIPGMDTSITYPVRDEAAGSLRQLGIKVHSFEHEHYVIDERFDNYLEQKELLEKAEKEFKEREKEFFKKRQQKEDTESQEEPAIALPSIKASQ